MRGILSVAGNSFAISARRYDSNFFPVIAEYFPRSALPYNDTSYICTGNGGNVPAFFRRKYVLRENP